MTDSRQAICDRSSELPLADHKTYLAGRIKARLVHFFSPAERRALESRVGVALGRRVAASERGRIVQAYYLYRAMAEIDGRFRRKAEFGGPAGASPPPCLWLTLMSPFAGHLLGYPQGAAGRLQPLPAPPDLPAFFSARVGEALGRAKQRFEGRIGVVTYRRLSPARERFDLRLLAPEEATVDRLRTLFTDIFHVNPAVYDWHESLQNGGAES